MSREKLVITTLAIGLTLLVACTTTTTLTSTWKAPDTQPINLSGRRIAAVFITNDDSLRRTGENALVADLTARGAHGFGTFHLLPSDQHFDGEAAESRLRGAGADAVVFMRVVGKDQRIIYTPGQIISPPYRGFRPYWGFGWRTVYQPGSLRTEADVSIETLVYSLTAAENSQLLWASTSRTTTANPANLNALVSEVAEATAREMANAGFLAR